MATSRCPPYCRGHGCGRPGAHTPAAGAAVAAAVPGLAQPEPGAGRGGRRPGDGAGCGAGVDPDGIRRPHPLRRRRRRRLPRRLPPAPGRAGRTGAPAGAPHRGPGHRALVAARRRLRRGLDRARRALRSSPSSCSAWPWRCGHPAPPTRVRPSSSRTLPWPIPRRRRPRLALPPRLHPSAGARSGSRSSSPPWARSSPRARRRGSRSRSASPRSSAVSACSWAPSPGGPDGSWCRPRCSPA